MSTETARRQMVKQQIRTWDVFDPGVLEVMESVQRDRFVPEQFADIAYSEAEIPIGHRQIMCAPSLEGRMLQSLELGPNDKVLEIGTGTGYLTACLASLVKSLTSVDIYQDFIDAAESRLAEAGINNVSLHCMDALASLPDGEFDAILVSGSMPQLEKRLVESLGAGGRMFVITGDSPAMSAQLITRDDTGEWQSTEMFETSIPPLVNAVSTPEFSF
jgi:protein-L-isoaspartate(D-aspartate) O-methyltransferase